MMFRNPEFRQEETQEMANTGLTDDMLRKELYVIFTRPTGSREEIMKLLPEHLKRQVELEKQGVLFAAGPMDPETEDKPRTGMIIVRAQSFAQAREIADADPLHAAGLREYEVWKWTMNEGSVTLTVNYSDQTAVIA